MAETTPSTPAETTHVIVRAYPKVVYLYLTWLASLVCGILQPASHIDDESGLLLVGSLARSAVIGRIWLAIFVFNILVISFEFSRIRSVAIVFFVLALIFAGIQWGFLSTVGDFLGGLELVMNKIFYFAMAAVFTIIYLLVFINTRFSYWEIQPNEILHHHGFLGDIHRYPTRGLRMKKEITDVFELILLRAGTLVLNPVGQERPIVLENVINITKVEDKIQRLLGTLKVLMDRGEVGGID
ncbi:MAG: hypothetical protein ACYTEZ_07055 [Planctomycetota bacterium]|jgi:hypothetical protein